MLPNADSLQKINAGRDVFYNFLSRSYQAEVDDEYLEMIVSLLPHIENMTSQTEFVALNTGGKLLREFVNHLTDLNTVTKKELLLGLARDFAYLFLTGVKSVPTCESVYRSPEHLLKQGSYLEVLKIYNTIGFQVPADFKEPEDHIAIQFKFMAVLAKKISRAIEASDYEDASHILAIQHKFVEEHLIKWIPQFCQLLIRTAEERDFYKAISHLTEGFLAMDFELIQNEISQSFRQTQPDNSVQAGV